MTTPLVSVLDMGGVNVSKKKRIVKFKSRKMKLRQSKQQTKHQPYK